MPTLTMAADLIGLGLIVAAASLLSLPLGLFTFGAGLILAAYLMEKR